MFNYNLWKFQKHKEIESLERKHKIKYRKINTVLKYSINDNPDDNSQRHIIHLTNQSNNIEKSLNCPYRYTEDLQSENLLLKSELYLNKINKNKFRIIPNRKLSPISNRKSSLLNGNMENSQKTKIINTSNSKNTHKISSHFLVITPEEDNQTKRIKYLQKKLREEREKIKNQRDLILSFNRQNFYKKFGKLIYKKLNHLRNKIDNFDRYVNSNLSSDKDDKDKKEINNNNEIKRTEIISYLLRNSKNKITINNDTSNKGNNADLLKIDTEDYYTLCSNVHKKYLNINSVNNLNNIKSNKNIGKNCINFGINKVKYTNSKAYKLKKFYGIIDNQSNNKIYIKKRSNSTPYLSLNYTEIDFYDNGSLNKRPQIEQKINTINKKEDEIIINEDKKKYTHCNKIQSDNINMKKIMKLDKYIHMDIQDSYIINDSDAKLKFHMNLLKNELNKSKQNSNANKQDNNNVKKIYTSEYKHCNNYYNSNKSSLKNSEIVNSINSINYNKNIQYENTEIRNDNKENNLNINTNGSRIFTNLKVKPKHHENNLLNCTIHDENNQKEKLEIMHFSSTIQSPIRKKGQILIKGLDLFDSFSSKKLKKFNNYLFRNDVNLTKSNTKNNYTTYYYHIVSHYRSQFKHYFTHRINWVYASKRKNSSDSNNSGQNNNTYINFEWKYYSKKVDYKKIKINPNNKNCTYKMVNVFEKFNEIGDKNLFFNNLLTYCNSNKLNIFEIIPMTFIIKTGNRSFKNLMKSFAILYEEYNKAYNYYYNNPNKKEEPTSKGIYLNILYKDIILKYLDITPKNNNLSLSNIVSNTEPTDIINMKIYEYYNELKNIYLYIPFSFISSKNYWIIKPNNLCQGKCIEISNNLNQIEKIIHILITCGSLKNKYPLNEIDSDNNHDQDQIDEDDENDDVPSPKNINTNTNININPYQNYQLNSSKKNRYNRHIPKAVIIQKYLDNPLLYNKRKFDIRCYVLIDFNYNLYFCREGHLKASSKEYNLENDNLFIHITNYSFQKHCNNFSKFETGNEISYRTFREYLQNENIDISLFDNAIEKMKSLIKISMLAIGSKKLSKITEDVLNFQLFGYDFILDNNFNPFLLEINDNPGFSISSPVIAKLIPRVIDDALRLTVDKIFDTVYDDSVVNENGVYVSKYHLDGYDDEENIYEFLGNIKDD